jgi:hypothetical protein
VKSAIRGLVGWCSSKHLGDRTEWPLLSARLSRTNSSDARQANNPRRKTMIGFRIIEISIEEIPRANFLIGRSRQLHKKRPDLEPGSGDRLRCGGGHTLSRAFCFVGESHFWLIRPSHSKKDQCGGCCRMLVKFCTKPKSSALVMPRQ